MSKIHEELLAEEGFWAEFDVLVSQRNYEGAGALMQKVGDLGYENLALRMHLTLNRLNPDLVYVPMEDNDHPILTPEEDDAPAPARHESEYATEYNDDGELKTFKK